MKSKPVTAVCILAAFVTVLAGGCQGRKQFSSQHAATPLGAISDSVWQTQELNAEMADFIVYQHEFTGDSEFLNTAGEDHVKQIASRLASGQDAKVVIERSFQSERKDTEYQYPIHPNAELDLRRRDIIARSLVMMGIHDAEERVLVAPSFAQGMVGPEAEAAYRNGMGSSNTGSTGGFGGFFFGGSGLF